MLNAGGEDSSQALIAIANLVRAYWYQRSLNRIVGIIGPLAIITISTVVGGLIVSVMTALLSVSQVVG